MCDHGLGLDGRTVARGRHRRQAASCGPKQTARAAAGRGLQGARVQARLGRRTGGKTGKPTVKSSQNRAGSQLLVSTCLFRMAHLCPRASIDLLLSTFLNLSIPPLWRPIFRWTWASRSPFGFLRGDWKRRSGKHGNYLVLGLLVILLSLLGQCRSRRVVNQTLAFAIYVQYIQQLRFP